MVTFWARMSCANCASKPAGSGRGPGRLPHLVSDLTSAFPDAHLELAHMVADDEHVSLAYTLSGTHRWDFNGIAPTRRGFEVRDGGDLPVPG
jgi:hypothetical protein